MNMKFGLAVGANIALACLLVQGCKAVPRNAPSNSGNEVKAVATETAPAPAQENDIKVAEAPANPPPAAEAKAPETAAEPVAVEKAPAEEQAVVYTVKRGDMLSKIAKRTGVRQKTILALNPGLSPDRIRIGQKINLPAGTVVPAAEEAQGTSAAPSGATAASVKAPKTAKYSGPVKEYVVKSGDSLGKIAYACGSNVRTIKELNNLKSDRVRIGQKLKVPANGKAEAKKAAVKKEPAAKKCKCPPGTVHDEACACGAADCKCAVKPAAAEPQPVEAAPAPEAADAAAAQPAAPVAETAADAPAAAPAESVAPAAASAPVAFETHTVKEGEDVVSISISYGVSPGALMEANDLKSSEVKPGDVLKIPAKSAQ